MSTNNKLLKKLLQKYDLSEESKKKLREYYSKKLNY
jgi:hypothetical protein